MTRHADTCSNTTGREPCTTYRCDSCGVLLYCTACKYEPGAYRDHGRVVCGDCYLKAIPTVTPADMLKPEDP